MGKFIDFAAIKEAFSMKDAIAMLDLEGRWKNNQWRGECPVHGGDRGLVISPQQGDFGAFNCNKFGKGGWDSISLVAHVNECSQYEAAKMIHEQIGTSTGTSKGTDTSRSTVPETQEAKETQKLRPLAHLIFDHETVAKFGLSPTTAEELGIGYAKKGIMAGRVVWPLYRDGELAGYIGYSPNHRNFKLPNNLISEAETQEGDNSNVVTLPKRA
jgi:phage/plasmid primase-like uncharacterized protein